MYGREKKLLNIFWLSNNRFSRANEKYLIRIGNISEINKIKLRKGKSLKRNFHYYNKFKQNKHTYKWKKVKSG